MTEMSADPFRHLLEVKTSRDSQGNKVKETLVFEEETLLEIFRNQHALHSLDAILRCLDETKKGPKCQK